jgi:hypothetical protein
MALDDSVPPGVTCSSPEQAFLFADENTDCRVETSWSHKLWRCLPSASPSACPDLRFPARIEAAATRCGSRQQCLLAGLVSLLGKTSE